MGHMCFSLPNVEIHVTPSLILFCAIIPRSKTMRPLASFPVLSFILAIVFLRQGSATPMSSDCIGRSSRKAKLGSDLEPVAGLVEDNNEDNGSSEWINYLKSFWKYIYAEESSYRPIPSPSESAIPNGVGEFPKKVQSKKSEKGFNEGSYKEFVLNQHFYLDLEEEAPADFYDKSKATLHILKKRAERGSLTGDQPEKWGKVSEAILKSYITENGAIFFDISFSQLWTYCGWVNMEKTFVLTDKHMRICVSLISIGMDDITRPPEEGKDFIVPGETDPQEIENLLEPIWAISGRQSLSKSVRQDSVTVDLLGYPEYCKLPTLYIQSMNFTLPCGRTTSVRGNPTVLLQSKEGKVAN